MKSRMVGICVKCWRISTLERHHIHPKRFFHKKNKSIILLCTDCHKQIERIIPKFKKLTKQEYIELHQSWLQDKPIPMHWLKEDYEMANLVHSNLVDYHYQENQRYQNA